MMKNLMRRSVDICKHIKLSWEHLRPLLICVEKYVVFCLHSYYMSTVKCVAKVPAFPKLMSFADCCIWAASPRLVSLAKFIVFRLLLMIV